MTVATTHVDDPVGDGGGRLNANLIVRFGVFTRLEAPLLFAGGRVDGVEVTVPAAEEHGALGHGGRRVNDVFGLEAPPLFAGHGVQRVEVPITAADVDDARGDHRRREKVIERIGHRLRLRRHSVHAFRLEATFGRVRERPARGARLRVDGVHRPVLAVDVHDTCRDRRRRAHRALRRIRPSLGTRRRVERVDLAVVTSDVDDSFGHRRRREHFALGGKRPSPSLQRAWSLCCVDTGVRGVTTERRLGDRRGRAGGPRLGARGRGARTGDERRGEGDQQRGGGAARGHSPRNTDPSRRFDASVANRRDRRGAGAIAELGQVETAGRYVAARRIDDAGR